jgi:hypothetical protein
LGALVLCRLISGYTGTALVALSLCENATSYICMVAIPMAWLMPMACIRIYTPQVIESIRKPHTNSENYIEYVYIDYWSIKGHFS